MEGDQSLPDRFGRFLVSDEYGGLGPARVRAGPCDVERHLEAVRTVAVEQGDRLGISTATGE